MEQPWTFLKNLDAGMKVEINPQKDRSRKKRVVGVIAKLLTRAPEHTHGILVELDCGETGRVKNILSTSSKSVVQSPIVQEYSGGNLKSLIDDANQENHFVEYKTSVLWSVKFSDQQIEESKSFELKKYGRNASKFIIAKAIASFLNTDGGNLIIGVKENKTGGKNEVVGIESEFFKLRDQCTDGYRRMIVDQIIKFFLPTDIFHHINDHLSINFEKINERTVCHLCIKPSNTKIFVNYHGTSHFFIRIDASSREICGENMVDYCLKRFT